MIRFFTADLPLAPFQIMNVSQLCPSKNVPPRLLLGNVVLLETNSNTLQPSVGNKNYNIQENPEQTRMAFVVTVQLNIIEPSDL